MSAPQPLLDRITNIDDILRGPILDELRSIGEGKGDSGAETRKKRTPDLTTNVPANSSDEDDISDSEQMPFDGFIDGIIGGWPDGADLSVGARVERTSTAERVFPGGSDKYGSYNAFTHVFPVSFPIEKGETITARFVNNKGTPVPINITLQAFRKHDHETMQDIREMLE